MSELGPITAELRMSMTHVDGHRIPMVELGMGEFMRLCDEIDAVHASLERENAELRERVAKLDKQGESMHETDAWKLGYDEGFANADDWLAQHEDAMAEHGWVKGPLDADGEMWRSGDMSDSNWGVIEGIAYEDGRWFVSGHDTSAPWVPADSIRHHHAPTVEDVLTKFSCVLMGKREFDGDVTEAIAEYAAKLRLAGSDAE